MEKKANTKIINYIDTMRFDLINKLTNINNQTLIEYIQRYPRFVWILRILQKENG